MTLPNKIIEIIIEIEGDSPSADEIAEELEGYVETMCPGAYRVNTYVEREEEI